MDDHIVLGSRVDRMKIELFHASHYGNGAKIAEEFQRIMVAKGHQVNIHHINESKPKALPSAELYVFGTPARIGKPIGGMRRFAKKVDLPSGTKYALFATHGAPRPDKKTGKIPAPEELERWYTSIPILTETLNSKGMVKVADARFFVTDLKGPLEEGWQNKVEGFAKQISP
jgi:flavodoxin